MTHVQQQKERGMDNTSTSAPPSPTLATKPAVQRIIGVNAALWERLENTLATTTLALGDYASTLCKIVTLL